VNGEGSHPGGLEQADPLIGKRNIVEEDGAAEDRLSLRTRVISMDFSGGFEPIYGGTRICMDCRGWSF
jgi:hypothetical protein